MLSLDVVGPVAADVVILGKLFILFKVKNPSHEI